MHRVFLMVVTLGARYLTPQIIVFWRKTKVLPDEQSHTLTSALNNIVTQGQKTDALKSRIPIVLELCQHKTCYLNRSTRRHKDGVFPRCVLRRTSHPFLHG